MRKVFTLKRRHFLKVLGAGTAMSAVGNSAWAAGQLQAFRMVQQENVMLHFDVNQAAPDARLFTLENPDRLVIDLPNTTLSSALQNEHYQDGVVSGMRFGEHAEDKLRIVVDLRRPVSPAFKFVERQGGQRLVVDLGVKGNPELANYQARITEPSQLRDMIVAIDAGHGGKDPGAIGQRKTKEKDITLSVALRLYKRLQGQKGITPVLIRNTDKYVALRERIRIARSRHADLFVSIHADAFKRREAQGSSVYALSLKGASSEAAQWLADKENEVDALFGDVALDGLSQDLKETLLNLTQNNTLEASMEVGRDVLAQLTRVGAVHKKQVEQANFAVLKSPDIPSVLVETAFISNLKEEKKLNNKRFQEQLAVAVQNGVTTYLKRRAPEGTYLYHSRSGTG